MAHDALDHRGLVDQRDQSETPATARPMEFSVGTPPDRSPHLHDDHRLGGQVNLERTGYERDVAEGGRLHRVGYLSLIHISEPTRLGMISYAVFCLKKKKKKNKKK